MSSVQWKIEPLKIRDFWGTKNPKDFLVNHNLIVEQRRSDVKYRMKIVIKNKNQ